jgi:hypothetical protein
MASLPKDDNQRGCHAAAADGDGRCHSMLGRGDLRRDSALRRRGSRSLGPRGRPQIPSPRQPLTTRDDRSKASPGTRPARRPRHEGCPPRRIGSGRHSRDCKRVGRGAVALRERGGVGVQVIGRVVVSAGCRQPGHPHAISRYARVREELTVLSICRTLEPYWAVQSVAGGQSSGRFGEPRSFRSLGLAEGDNSGRVASSRSSWLGPRRTPLGPDG